MLPAPINPQRLNPSQKPQTTPVGFEPTRGDPIGLAGRRLNRSAKVSLMLEQALESVVSIHGPLGYEPNMLTTAPLR